MSTPIRDAYALGFSVWLDNLSRGLVRSGELAQMVGDGLVGVTSNPTIFERAIDGTCDYDDAVAELVAKGASVPEAIYERLVIDDIRGAADVLRPVYVRTNGRDGFVSLEVSPYLAHDTNGTVQEARRLFTAVARDNVMIKVPGTVEGTSAVEQLIGVGVNVNITLLFAIDAYRAAIDAYHAGIDRLIAQGGYPAKVTSVASFFLSRIDTVIDDRLTDAMEATRDPERREQLGRLFGTIAVASAKVAYRVYQQSLESPRWQALARAGARTQRLVWASTSTKDPRYGKTKYVDGLIGRDTISAMTVENYVEFRDHGRARSTILDNIAEAEHALAALAGLGISLPDAASALTEDGIARFTASFDRLLAAIARKRQLALEHRLRA
jgi:transaldolase/glucose-6-phosphate isomerase